MKSGIMTFHHNKPEKFIDDTEYLFQYRIWLQCGLKGEKPQTNTTQVINTQLYGGSKPVVFANITILTYIRPVKCNVQILNDTKCFGLVIVKNPKKTSLYHSGHHNICQKIHKTQYVKIPSNITINLEASELSL